MLSKTPTVVELSAATAHRLDRGGSPMEIKHTHPSHADEDVRRSEVRDKQRICLALIRAQREKAKGVRRRSA